MSSLVYECSHSGRSSHLCEACNSLRADFRRFGAGMGTFKFYMMQNASAKPRTVASKSVAGRRQSRAQCWRRTLSSILRRSCRSGRISRPVHRRRSRWRFYSVYHSIYHPLTQSTTQNTLCTTLSNSHLHRALVRILCVSLYLSATYTEHNSEYRTDYSLLPIQATQVTPGSSPELL